MSGVHSHHGEAVVAAPCGGCEDGSRAAAAGRRQMVSRMRQAVGLAAAYMVAEAVGGWLTNSLALLADAGHMLSDVAALAVSLAAIGAASRATTSARTYGYHRAEVLGALLNAVVLCMVAVGICWEAVGRLGSPPDVRAPVAFAIATGGLVVNLSGLYLLGGHLEHGIGVKGAWLHLLGDALGSVGAMVSALLVGGYGWRWADPAASLLIAVLIIRSGTALLLETVGVLMEGAPSHIDVDRLRSDLRGLAGVLDVHDLHVWTITTGMDAVSGHVVVEAGRPGPSVLHEARTLLRERFGVGHVTLQIEEAAGAEVPAVHEDGEGARAC